MHRVSEAQPTSPRNGETATRSPLVRRSRHGKRPLKMLGLVTRVARWRLTWNRYDADATPAGLPPKFMSAKHAASLVADRATVVSSGMAGNARCRLMFLALRDRFLATSHPRELTWVALGAQGGRGKVPGTLEELGRPGLVARVVSSHFETLKSMLRLAERGEVVLHAVPLGTAALAIEAQARGEDSVVSQTGVGTILDPRTGAGSRVGALHGESLIEPAEGGLQVTLPRIDTALIAVPYADREGNLYARDASVLTEAREGALAARRHGGTVIATVCGIVPKQEDAIFLPAEAVDAIVVDPGAEQTILVAQRRPWVGLTQGAREDVDEMIARLRQANRLLGITPKRTAADNVMARLGATVFASVARPGAMVNIGVGHPEEVCRVIHQAGLSGEVEFCSETGVVGGLPAPGIFFGAAINPTRVAPSAELFHRVFRQLDTTILGLLQVDAQGNVNVSRRGPRYADYVGPGGLPDLCQAARNIVFVGSLTVGSDIQVRNGRLAVGKAGKAKFVRQVDEVTFSGAEALRRGQRVHYVTHLGYFRLTTRGVELVAVMPGVDVRRDILDACPMAIVLPEGGAPRVLDSALVTGEGFQLRWGGGQPAEGMPTTAATS